MKIFQEIRKEHEDFREWSQKISETTDRAVKTREDYFKTFYIKLIAHNKAEEYVFNPVLRGNKETKEFAIEIEEEHYVIGFLMEELKALPVNRENWLIMFKIMKKQLDHHLEKEEDEISPKVRQIFEIELLENLMDKFNKKMREQEKKLEESYTPFWKVWRQKSGETPELSTKFGV